MISISRRVLQTSNDTFGCCSSYQECSNCEKCIKPEFMNRCDYWLLNLSKGRNFYKKDCKENEIQESNHWVYKQLSFL